MSSTPLQNRFGVEICGAIDEPGAALADAALVDFSRMPVCTPDQQRIEDVLRRRDLSDKDLLHVGMGNSHLAARMASLCRRIDGITVAEPERQVARAMAIANYVPHKANKYAVSLPAILQRHFDVIIDNNLASFACCGFHLMTMFSSYRLMLRPGGCILTDRQGMAWTASDDRWRLSEDDLSMLAGAFGFAVTVVTDSVFELTK